MSALVIVESTSTRATVDDETSDHHSEALPLDPPADRKVRTGKSVTIADVDTFAVANIPPGRAGALTTELYLALLAFDLAANGVDLGRTS